jgi:hypothetical protein
MSTLPFADFARWLTQTDWPIVVTVLALRSAGFCLALPLRHVLIVALRGKRFLLVTANRFGHSSGGVGVLDASVGRKRFVTFGFVFPLHFIKRIT